MDLSQKLNKNKNNNNPTNKNLIKNINNENEEGENIGEQTTRFSFPRGRAALDNAG